MSTFDRLTKNLIFSTLEKYYQVREILSQNNPVREHVDTTKEIPKYIKPYVQPESHPNPSIRGLPSDLSNWPPGEMGIGVSLDNKLMPKEETDKRTAMYKNHAFEEYVSELILLERSLPDFRGQWYVLYFLLFWLFLGFEG